MQQIIDDKHSAMINLVKRPEELFGQLFYDVQKSRIFNDDKAFLDMVPKEKPETIVEKYQAEKDSVGFSLSDFVRNNFDYDKTSINQHIASDLSAADYINTGWGYFSRNSSDRGSLLSLPNAYVVPGGRFNEQFYWDSYFIMLGLAADNKWSIIEGMVDNIAYMINKFGFVPTANRTYFLSRSQPPFFSNMIELLAIEKGDEFIIKYLPYLLSEYEFWMKGSDELIKLDKTESYRVVKMPSGEILNRYFDNMNTPRPEAINGDEKLAAEATWCNQSQVYLNLRAAAESGWDFSSRWFYNPMDIHTIQTTNIIPIDLNCLIYQLEMMISKLYKLSNNLDLSEKFADLASIRANVLNEYCWDKKLGFYFDYDFKRRIRTERFTLASVFPLFTKLATQHQADLVAECLRSKFLKNGGLVTTLIESGQQWDSPNGWAPLHWAAITGLRNYGHDDLADEIKKRWVSTNVEYFNIYAKFVEKYDVVNTEKSASGGEYRLQEGFGWTNGVLAALVKNR